MPYHPGPCRESEGADIDGDDQQDYLRTLTLAPNSSNSKGFRQSRTAEYPLNVPNVEQHE